MKKIMVFIFFGLSTMLFINDPIISEESTNQSTTPQVVTSQTPSNNEIVANTQQINTGGSLEKIGGVLLIFLVLSIVFESALTPLFTWSIFLKYFDGRGYKVPITVIFAFLMFWKYDLDIIRDLLIALNYYQGKIPENHVAISFWGQILTALLIAGGSDGVFQIFTKLRIRNPTETRQRAEILKAGINGKLIVTLSGADPKTTRNISIDGSTKIDFTEDIKEISDLSSGDHTFIISAQVGGQQKTITKQIKIDNGATIHVQIVL